MFHQEIIAITIICFAAMTGGLIMLRFQQPALIGYILAGVILGPSGLHLVQESHNITVLAEMGVTLLLFLIGMELSLKAFKSVYKIAISTTALQITGALLVSCGLGYLLGWPVNRSVLIGFAMAMSSTAVAIKILENTGQKKNKAGQLAVAVLIAQDLAIVPMLLIVSALGAGSDGLGAQTVMQIFGAVAILAGIIWFLGKQGDYSLPVVSKIKLESGVITLISLTACFLFASVAGAFGLSTAFGAFIAGLIIGNSREHEQFMEVTQPIHEVLMMVFFLSIGLLIDIGFIFEKFWELIVLLIMTLLLKSIGNIFILRFLKVPRNETVLASLSLAQIGEFSFIIAATGLASGAIIDEGYRMMITLIALSLAASPLWYDAAYFILGQPLPKWEQQIFEKLSGKLSARWQKIIKVTKP